MARIDIPKPISTYRDLGTVELAKLARNQYIEGYGAADEFSNSVSNMQALEKDQHIKNKLSEEYTGMLDGWASRGDYETLGIAINKGANQFVQDYSPVQTSVTNRNDYLARLKAAYEKGDINANTYQGRAAQSDMLYQGIQYGEDGSLVDNSVYSGKEFYHDVDITKKINKRLKEIEPFIRENLGTSIPYNENMEITSTTNARGEPKYWVNTKSKTVELPSSIIQDVVNDVMSEADVIASLAQEVEMKTYQLGDEGAMEHINKLLASGDLKEEDLVNEKGESLLETMGPLVALQNLMYHNSVSRETQLAIGAFGGVRESSYGQTISYDEMYKINEKAKLTNAKKTKVISDDNLSYNTLVQIKPKSTSYEDAVNNQKETVDLIKGNLDLVSGQLNVDPDKIETDDNGNEIFGSGGQGLNLEEMNTSEIIQNTEALVDGWKVATTQANTKLVDYMSWRTDINTLQPLEDGNGNIIEDQNTYLTRLDDAYKAYENSIIQKRQVGMNYLTNVAGTNDLDIDKFNSTMHILSAQTQDYDVANAKLNSPLGLSIPNSEGYGTDLTYSEYVKARNNQLLTSEMGHGDSDLQITGQDIVDGYNWLASSGALKLEMEGQPTLPSSISNLTELPDMFYEGNIFESFAFAGNRNENIHGLIQGIAKVKQNQGHRVSATYQRGTGEYTWAGVDDGYRYDNNNQQQSFNMGVSMFINQLNEDKSNLDKDFASHFSGTPMSLEAAVITNFGSNFETTSTVNDQLKDFFKDNVIPSNFSMRDAQGESPNMGWKEGFLNSNKKNEKNHFGNTVEYDIIEEQMGVLNLELGDDGAMIYVPIKITKGGNHVGKVFNYLVPAHYFDLPALSEYVNSPEMEVNTQWNLGVLNRIDEWSPSQYSNVTFKYDRSGGGKDEIIIDGEKHSKEKGLSILVQNLINNRSRRHHTSN